MTKIEILKMLTDLGDDAYVYEHGDDISVDLNDFEGFDENWSETMRDYDNPKKVQQALDTLQRTAIIIEDNFYTTYHFEDCSVIVGYASYEI